MILFMLVNCQCRQHSLKEMIMNFIKAIFAAICNIVATAVNFTVGPFMDMSSKDEQTRKTACFSVLLRVLVAIGFVFGLHGLVIAVANMLLTISLYLTLLNLIIQTISILSTGLAGAELVI